MRRLHGRPHGKTLCLTSSNTTMWYSPFASSFPMADMRSARILLTHGMGMPLVTNSMLQLYEATKLILQAVSTKNNNNKTPTNKHLQVYAPTLKLNINY